MADVAAFADVEAWLVAALDLPDKVATRVPNPRPNRFHRVLVTGGPGRQNRISEIVTVSLESYAPTETAAQQMAQDARSALAEMQGRRVAGVHVKTVTEDSRPGNLPHPTIPGSRYVQSFSLHLKGAIAP